MKNHRVFIIRNGHIEWSYDHYTPDDEQNALEIPVAPGDVIVDGSGLAGALFEEFHQGVLRRRYAHEPERLYTILDDSARVTVPDHVAPVELQHETVYQPEFHRIVSRPKPDALEIAAATARLENATETRRATQESRPPELKPEPVRAYWAEIREPATEAAPQGRRVKRAVFPHAQLVHVFEGGTSDLATEDTHVLKDGDALMGRKHLGSGRPGATPAVKLGGGRS